MINLLPTAYKEELYYGRRNALLSKWIMVSFSALIGVGLLIAVGLVLINQSIDTNSKQVADAQAQLKSQKIEETQKEIESISNNTKLVLQVLSKEILFSKLLRQLGSVTPANTTLVGLQVDKLQGGLTLIGNAKDINSATQLQVNLQDPKNNIFEKADIETINCDNADSKKGGYPCAVQIRALFGKNNPYLYIAPTTAQTNTTEKKQ